MWDEMWEMSRPWWVLRQGQLLSPRSFPRLPLSSNAHRRHYEPICSSLTMDMMRIVQRLQRLVQRALGRKSVYAEPISDHTSPPFKQTPSASRTSTSSLTNNHQPHRLSKIVEVTEILDDVESSQEERLTDQ
jgi:hypothetical protein